MQPLITCAIYNYCKICIYSVLCFSLTQIKALRDLISNSP